MLENIRGNIEKLIAAYEDAKVKNDRLTVELERSKTQIEAYRKQITELENKIDNLNLTGAFLGKSGDVNEAKSKIDRMVREIDRCISLLEA